MSILKFLKTLKTKGNISPLKSSSYYSEFKSYLSSNEISNVSLDLLFEWYTLVSIDQYCKEKPSPPSKQCNFGGNGKESIFITCEQCCTFLENYCICLNCFINSPHEHMENHKMILYKSSGAICDCGNASIMKSSGFCSNHCESDCANSSGSQQSRPNSEIENNSGALSSTTSNRIGASGNASPLSVSGTIPFSSSPNTTFIVNDGLFELRLFFRHLFRYVSEIISTENLSDATISKESELISKIEAISMWMINLLSKSSILLNLVTEELLGQVVDESMPLEQIYKDELEKLQPIILDVASPTKRSKKLQTTNSNIIEAQNNIEIIINHNYIIHYLYPFLIHLICNHKPFKYLFLKYMLPNYNEYYQKSFTKEQCNGASIISVAYIGDDTLINQVSQDTRPEYNLVNIVLQQNTRSCNEVLSRVYTAMQSNEHWFRSDLYILKTIFKIDSVVKFILSDAGHFILDSLFESAVAIHKLTCANTVPYHETLGFVKELETNLQYLVNILLDHSPASLELVVSKLKQHIPHLSYGDATAIKPHFPFYRMLSSILLQHNPLLLNKLDFSEQVYIEMAKALLKSHMHEIVFGLGHVRSKAMEQFADYTTYLDLHLLQHVVVRISPSKFIDCFVECASNLHPSIQTRNKMSIVMSLLISILQARPNPSPSAQEVRHHLIQYMSVHDRLFTDRKAMAFIFDDFPLDQIQAIYSEICNKENKAKYVLKKEYWNHIDPHYFHHNQETKRLRPTTKYHLNPASSAPLPPASLPTITNTELLNIMDLINDEPLFNMLLKMLAEQLYQHQLPKEDKLHQLFRNYNITNDCLYIISLSLQMFKEYTLPSLDLIANRSINHSISKYIAVKSRQSIETPMAATSTVTTRPASSSTVVPQKFSIVSLLSSMEIYKKNANGVSEPTQLSLLDIMVDQWRETTVTLDQEQRPLLQQIFLTMIDIDEQFKSYFNSCNVIIETPEEVKKKLDEQKKSVSDKRKKLLMQMRQQQLNFLQLDTENIGSPTTSNVSFGTPMTPEHQHNGDPNNINNIISASESNYSLSAFQSNNNNENEAEADDSMLCIVCNQCSTTDEPLHAIGSVDKSPMLPHLQRQEYEKVLSDTSITIDYRKAYNDVRSRLLQDVQSVLQSSESAEQIRSMLPMAFPYIYPTYVRSCHHYIHQSCLIKLNENYTKGFACPLCSTQSNMVIPLPNHTSKQSTLLQHHQTMATFDMKSMKTPVTDKYVWKFVSQNIELLEIKTRSTTLYNEPNEDPYFILTENEFEKELFSLYLLFNSVMSNPNQFTTLHDIQQTNSKLIRTMDPFSSYSFMVYLLYHHHNTDSNSLEKQIQADLNSTLECFYNQIILHYIYKEKQYTNTISTLADIKRSPHMFPGLLENSNNQLPFFRKLYLFTFLFDHWKSENPLFGQNNMSKSFSTSSITGMVSSASTSNLSSISSPNSGRKTKLSNPFNLTLEQFSNLDFLMERLGLTTLQSYIQTLNLRDFDKHLEKQPVCYPFPLRPYDSAVKFIDLPNRYFDYLKQMVSPLCYCNQCKSLITRSCLLCNTKLCLQTTCNNTIRSHMKTCPSQVLGVYLRFEDPGVTLLTYNSSRYYKIYRSPDGSSTSAIDTSFVLYKKGLKKIYKLWINNQNKKIGHK